MTKDRMIGIIIMVLGVIWFYLSFQIKGNAYSSMVGPDIFPKIASGGLILCGAGLIVRKQRPDGEQFLDNEGWLRVLQITVAIALYPVVLQFFGFILASIYMIFTATTLFDVENSLHMVKRGIFATVSTAALYFFFSKELEFILPIGKLFEKILG